MQVVITLINNRKITFNTDNIIQYCKSSSEVFELCEKVWHKWYNTEIDHNPEIEDMYFSQEAVYTKKGAIIGAIEAMAEQMEETPDKRYYSENEVFNMDLEATFN